MGIWDKVLVGLQLTVYGTGLVFLVLAFLWGVMRALLWLDREQGPKVGGTLPSPARARAAGLTAEERAAVTLAVLAYKGLVGRGGAARAGRQAPNLVSSSWVAVGRARQLRRPRVPLRVKGNTD